MPATSPPASGAARLTHLALHVRSLRDSVAFYEEFTALREIARHSDAASTGLRVVWLGDAVAGSRPSFVLVLLEGTPRLLPDARPQPPLGPISHLGFGMASREEVDAVAAIAQARGILRLGPALLNENAGYLCIITDPDGHLVEFSHGQKLGPVAEEIS